MNTRRLSTMFYRAAALALLFTVAACDNDGDGDVDEADLLVGSWSLTNVEDETGNRLADFEMTYSDFLSTFQSDGDVVIFLDTTDPDTPDISVTAAYEINQTNNTVTLTVTTPGGPVAIEFEYLFVDDDTLELTTGALLMNLVFGTTLVGESTITLSRT